MLAVERRRVIAEALRSRGVVSVVEMAEQLGTTEITVRRDLRAMAKDGLVMRARGGAILPAPIGHEPSYSEKARQAAAEKASIARLAVQMIRPGDSILLGPGTTTQALAELLVDFPELTVVTNSLLVAQALPRSPPPARPGSTSASRGWGGRATTLPPPIGGGVSGKARGGGSAGRTGPEGQKDLPKPRRRRLRRRTRTLKDGRYLLIY